MLRHSFITLGLIGTVAVALAADDVDKSKIPAAASKTVDFNADIKPLFEKSCVKCHSGAKPKSGYSMETREATLKGGDSEKASVVEGKGADSPLVHYIADAVVDMEMPPTDKREKYPALTKEQIALVRAWVDQGAKWPDGVKLVPAAQ